MTSFTHHLEENLMSHLPSARWRPSLAVLVTAVAVLLMLTGCASGSATDSTDATRAAAPGQGAGGQTGGGATGGGGVSGRIAAVSGTVLQIQSTDSQTAVTYTADTVITQTVSATLDQVAVGSCILAVAPGSTDDATAAVSTVGITTAVGGACSGRFGGGGGGGLAPGGMPTDVPTGMPTDMPTGMPTGMPTDGAAAGGFGQLTGGLVTAVAGTTITVKVTGRDSTTSTEAVEVAADTTYTTTVAADASVVAVGLCAVAQGASDNSGQVTATTLTLSVAGDDGCTRGAGVGGGMGRGPAGSEATDG